MYSISQQICIFKTSFIIELKIWLYLKRYDTYKKVKFIKR